MLIEGSQVKFSKYNIIFLSLKIIFVLENIENTDEIPHYRDSDQIPIPWIHVTASVNLAHLAKWTCLPLSVGRAHFRF